MFQTTMFTLGCPWNAVLERAADDAFCVVALLWGHRADSFVYSMKTVGFLKHCDSLRFLCYYQTRSNSTECAGHRAIRVSRFSRIALYTYCICARCRPSHSTRLCLSTLALLNRQHQNFAKGVVSADYPDTLFWQHLARGTWLWKKINK